MEAKNAKEYNDRCRSETDRNLSEKKYPESFRLVRYHDEEKGREFTSLTNAKQLSVLDVANLYKKRWLIELFFKWLKAS